MNDPNESVNAKRISGRVVAATVIKVLPFGAFLRLPGVNENGYLTISQVSDKTIDPPLTNTLKEGDQVDVLVKWFDGRHQTWETSHKALVQRHAGKLVDGRPGRDSVPRS